MKKIIFFFAICLSLAGANVFGQDNLYINEDIGLSIKGPQGWYKVSGEQLRALHQIGVDHVAPDELTRKAMKKTGPLVSFFKDRPGFSVDYNASISLVIEDLSGFPFLTDDASEYLAATARFMRMTFKDFKILEEPSLASIGGVSGAKMTTYGVMAMGHLEIPIKQIMYAFLIDSKVYLVGFTDLADRFDSILPIAEKSMATFSFK